MAIFNEENFGKPISKELSNYIIYNQKMGNIKHTAIKYNYNPETLTSIVRGYRNLNIRNSQMVTDLIKTCIKNYMSNERTKESINQLIQRANEQN